MSNKLQVVTTYRDFCPMIDSGQELLVHIRFYIVVPIHKTDIGSLRVLKPLIPCCGHPAVFLMKYAKALVFFSISIQYRTRFVR